MKLKAVGHNAGNLASIGKSNKIQPSIHLFCWSSLVIAGHSFSECPAKLNCQGTSLHFPMSFDINIKVYAGEHTYIIKELIHLFDFSWNFFLTLS